jgi:hypothetical protein
MSGWIDVPLGIRDLFSTIRSYFLLARPNPLATSVQGECGKAEDKKKKSVAHSYGF